MLTTTKTAPPRTNATRPKTERCPAMISLRQDFDKYLEPCLHEDFNCDCDRIRDRGKYVPDPSQVAIEASAARIRASWTSQDELDRRVSGQPVACELLRFAVPQQAQALDQDVAEYYLKPYRPRPRKWRQAS